MITKGLGRVGQLQTMGKLRETDVKITLTK